MSSRFDPEAGNRNNNTPIACFQKLCQVMLSDNPNGLSKKNIEDFRVILHIIMHECSKANIESGKVWVANHCRTYAHASALMEYILSLSKSRKGQQERLHLIYLVSDVLFHASRRQHNWLKQAIITELSPLLSLAYESTDAPEYKAKVLKVISLWEEYNVFDSNAITYLREGLLGKSTTAYNDRNFESSHNQSQQPAPHQYQPQQNYQQPQFIQQPQYPPFPQQQQYNAYQPHPPPALSPQQLQQQFYPPPPHTPPAPPQKQYFELPAGLMLATKTGDYIPIDPTKIKAIHPCPPPSKEIIEGIEEFYKNLPDSDQEISILETNQNQNQQIDAQGWEKGYLDFHYEYIANRKKNKGSELHRQQSSSRSYDNGRRDRSYDRHSGNRHRSYSRSQSPPSGRYGSPPRRRNHSPPRSSRGRSPPRRRSPPRDRSPVRRNSPPPSSSSRYNRRRYSRSRSPPTSSLRNSRGDFGTVPPPENKYLGLGNATASDEFDSFRRNKSQAYNRREPHQPLTCYKCNKAGHLARECQSL